MVSVRTEFWQRTGGEFQDAWSYPQLSFLTHRLARIVVPRSHARRKVFCLFNPVRGGNNFRRLAGIEPLIRSSASGFGEARDAARVPWIGKTLTGPAAHAVVISPDT